MTDADGRTQTYAYTTGSPVWPNLALNKPATGSTLCSPSEGPDKAVNGTVNGGTSDKWCSAAASKWWQVYSGSVTALTTVKIRHAAAGFEPAYFNTRDFNVQVSVDGTTWTSVATVAGNTDAVTTPTFAPTASRYVRAQRHHADSEWQPVSAHIRGRGLRRHKLSPEQANHGIDLV